jgi:hypothetical protein
MIKVIDRFPFFQNPSENGEGELFSQLWEQRNVRNAEPLALGNDSGYGLPIHIGLRELPALPGSVEAMDGGYVLGLFEKIPGKSGSEAYRPVGYMTVSRGPLNLTCRSAQPMKEVYGGVQSPNMLEHLTFEQKVDDDYFSKLSHFSESENALEVGMGMTFKSRRDDVLRKYGLDETSFNPDRKVPDISPYGRRGLGIMMTNLVVDIAKREHKDVMFYRCSNDSKAMLETMQERGIQKVLLERPPGESRHSGWIYAWTKPPKS